MAEGTKNNKVRTLLLVLGAVIAAGAAVTAVLVWLIFFRSNVTVTNESAYLYIPTGGSFANVIDSLQKNRHLANVRLFRMAAKAKKYPQSVKPGRYLLVDGMTNNALIDILRSGRQTPVKVAFSNARTKRDLVKKVTTHLEMKPEDLMKVLNDADFDQERGFDTTKIVLAFIPNTYSVYWNIAPEALVKRMMQEYDKFWNEERLEKAKSLGLSKTQVGILASIVQSETLRPDEKPKIAGVYINRLERGMPLEADPTLVFAIGDFTKQRVLERDKQINSPYNTYMYRGLPPGPICIPDASSIDAVLNADKHKFLYFCAKEDFSGYSNFACTYQEHLQNARKYTHALNLRHIYK